MCLTDCLSVVKGPHTRYFLHFRTRAQTLFCIILPRWADFKYARSQKQQSKVACHPNETHYSDPEATCSRALIAVCLVEKVTTQNVFAWMGNETTITCHSESMIYQVTTDAGFVYFSYSFTNSFVFNSNKLLPNVPLLLKCLPQFSKLPLYFASVFIRSFPWLPSFICMVTIYVARG